MKFRLVARSELGTDRKARRKPGFTQSVVAAIESFYGDVIQNLSAYQARAPQLSKNDAYRTEDRARTAALGPPRQCKFTIARSAASAISACFSLCNNGLYPAVNWLVTRPNS